MAAGVMLMPYADLEESSEVSVKWKTQRQELELHSSFNPFSQGKKPFLWKGHDLKKKNTLEVTSLKHARKLSPGSYSLLP